jgi:hypothetical protein
VQSYDGLPVEWGEVLDTVGHANMRVGTARASGGGETPVNICALGMESITHLSSFVPSSPFVSSSPSMASYMPLGPGSGFDVSMPVATDSLSGAVLDQQSLWQFDTTDTNVYARQRSGTTSGGPGYGGYASLIPYTYIGVC